MKKSSLICNSPPTGPLRPCTSATFLHVAPLFTIVYNMLSNTTTNGTAIIFVSTHGNKGDGGGGYLGGEGGDKGGGDDGDGGIGGGNTGGGGNKGGGSNGGDGGEGGKHKS